MVSLACSLPRAEQLIAGWGERLNIATVNGIAAVVVSGEVDALAELMQRCEADDIRARKIDVDYASHSAQVDAIREPLADALHGIEPRSSAVAFFSTVTGEPMDTAGLNADYWFQSIRHTVQFERAVRSACDAGYTAFIESSPHPVLMAAIEETMPDSERGCVIPSLGRDDGGLDRFWLSVAQAHVAGLGCGLARRDVRDRWPPRRPADIWVCPATLLASGRVDGIARRRQPGPVRGRARVARCGGAAARFRWCGARRAGCRRPRTRGWPITRSARRCCSREPGSSSWPSAPATRSVVGCSTS